MNPDIKELWIDALLDGKRQQGTGTLKRVVDGVARYCCLGVLCELAEEAGVVHSQPFFIDSESAPLTKFAAMEDSFDYEMGVLPLVVLEWAGMDNSTGRFRLSEAKSSSLTTLNDGGISFEEIAEYIKHYF